MGNLAFAIPGKILLFIIIAIFFNSCANKDIAKKRFEKGDYDTAYKIWEKWADANYADINLKLATLIQKGLVKKSDEEAIQRAKKAYEKGLKRAAKVLLRIYAKQKNYKKALYWLQRCNIYSFNGLDIDTYITVVSQSFKDTNQTTSYLNKLDELIKNGNAMVAYKLGKFYQNRQTKFYDINKSISYFTKGYKLFDTSSSLELAHIYLDTKHEKKALEILKKLSRNGNSKASVLLGDFNLKRINTSLKKYLSPCIATHFKKPDDFYTKKITALKAYKQYLKTKVVPFYLKAYKYGNEDALAKLISLDLLNDNFFNSSDTYSHLNLKNAITYLKNMKKFSTKTVDMLSKLYTLHPTPKNIKEAENLYLSNMDQNRTFAQWSLYKIYKKFDLNPQKRYHYLKDLINSNFAPAVIEQAYIDISKKRDTKHSYAILKKWAKKSNLSALKYLFDLSVKHIVKNSDTMKIGRKICNMQPISKWVDLEFADYFRRLGTQNGIIKAATIYRFYAENGDTKSQIALSNIYDKYKDFPKSSIWIKKAKKSGNKKAIFLYSIKVLKDKIPGDKKNALKIVTPYTKSNNKQALIVIGDMYANGLILPYNPKKALYYYKKLDSIDKKTALYKILNLYKSINIAHKFDNHIISTYLQLIDMGEKSLIFDMLNFLNQQNRYKKTYLKNYPKVKQVLRGVFKGNYLQNIFLKTNKKSDIDTLYKKDLYDAFISNICQNKNNIQEIYGLIKQINNIQTVENILNSTYNNKKCMNYKKNIITTFR